MGPLKRIRVIELAGIGPGPFCGMMLADMGADVIRIERPNTRTKTPKDVLARNRRSVALDLKKPEGIRVALSLIDSADALIEGFRPGVTERLGLGPEVTCERNKKLVYGRMTGWGQEGPLSQAAGHDLNYIGLAGALHGIGRVGEKPAVPLNLVGDFGGGGMLLAYGVVCALLEAKQSGVGQVIDAAMVDGASALMAMFYGMAASNMHSEERGTNLLDGGAHFYDTYETRDGKWICIGSIEPQFYAELIAKTEIDDPEFEAQMQPAGWPGLKEKLTNLFKTKTRDEWCAVMEGTDVCFAPVLSLSEAHLHPHAKARNSFVEMDGLVQPAPAPRFSRTQAEVSHGARLAGQDSVGVLEECGFSSAEIESLVAEGVLGTNS